MGLSHTFPVKVNWWLRGISPACPYYTYARSISYSDCAGVYRQHVHTILTLDPSPTVMSQGYIASMSILYLRWIHLIHAAMSLVVEAIVIEFYSPRGIKINYYRNWCDPLFPYLYQALGGIFINFQFIFSYLFKIIFILDPYFPRFMLFKNCGRRFGFNIRLIHCFSLP